VSAYDPVIIAQGPAWWQVLLLSMAGGVVALLARDGWTWLVDQWGRPFAGGTQDTTADDPSRDYDAVWRARGGIPVVPDRPTEVVAKWWHTRHGLHLYGCSYAVTGTPLPYTYTVEQATLEAEERNLRPCRSCDPLGLVQVVETSLDPTLLDAEPAEAVSG
jgi:hypothetical protein